MLRRDRSAFAKVTAQQVWRERRKYFARDFHERFLKKYPKELDNFTFVSDENEERGVQEMEFKGRKLLLNLFADNKHSPPADAVLSSRSDLIYCSCRCISQLRDCR